MYWEHPLLPEFQMPLSAFYKMCVNYKTPSVELCEI